MKQIVQQSWRRVRRFLWIAPAAVLAIALAPSSVTLSGDFQSELGCSGDNDPACVSTDLTYSAANDKWTGTFTIPSGTWTYRAALNHAASPSYGPVTLTGTGAAVKFYYDDISHWVGDSVSRTIATLAGSFQSEAGCPGDWAPDCLKTMLTDADGDGIYSFSTTGIPAGPYEFKVAYNEAWTTSYGDKGGSDNIGFRVTATGAPVTFSFNPRSHWSFLAGSAMPNGLPTAVTVAGTFQSEAGCTGDWLPDCATTHLIYDAEDDVFQRSFTVPAGAQEYKAPLNDSWTVSYGLNSGSANIAFNNPSAGSVKFYYDDKTHFATDSVGGGGKLAVAVGDWQNQVGCLGSWDPSCLRGMLADTDSDGVYDVVTAPVPPGTWHLKVAMNEAWTENYGDNCAANGSDIAFTVPAGPAQPMYFAYVKATNCIRFNVGGKPKGDLGKGKGIWLAQDVIVWDLGGDPPAGAAAELRFDPNAGITLDPVLGLTGGNPIPLTFVPGGLQGALALKFPHLKNLQVFRFTSGVPASIKSMLKGQLALGIKNSMGAQLDATSLRIPGVLDDLYAAAARPVELGVTWAGGVPTFRVWAPTAQNVQLSHGPDPLLASVSVEPMTLDAATGVWSVGGQAAWKGEYYRYDVTVYAPSTRTVVTNLVPDPYSVDVSINGTASHIVDLADIALKPPGWDGLTRRALAAPTDAVFYELHVRDFSATDPSVLAARRGKYLAFTDPGTNGMKHLKALSEAGLTHVHLLPAFDFATVDENPATWPQLDFDYLRGLGPDSTQQQTYTMARAGADGFNWGYDPELYGTPEGSYATDPNGGKRVIEFRQMVQGLSGIGLRTVMDVVYNHTNSSGQNPNSVLDKIVPGYYYRLNGEGFVEKSTCCDNTATEHAMMGKLTVDTLVTWAREYKLGGFRFDLMGHMPKDVILEAQTRLRAVDPTIYLYGEGWNFGEVENNKQFVQAKQADMAGTGVGTFNDRIRDAVRGGSPFTAITDQGFATGLWSAPNQAAASIPLNTQRRRLLASMDNIRLSLAANLKTYTFLDASGVLKPGSELLYNDNKGAGYTLVPADSINYVSAHDNMTLFDAIQGKAAAGDDMKVRVRYNNLAVAIAMLAQGIPFFHAGDEILRSKSGDTNSYDSGDWFNQVDWTLETNTWGMGAPPQRDNGNNWAVLRPLLAKPELRPTKADMEFAQAVFMDFLRIRQREPLFRLTTADAVQRQVTFHNVGATQTPGLIVMSLTVNPRVDNAVEPADGDLMVLFNGTPDSLSWQGAEFASRNFQIHELQAGGADEVVKGSSYYPLTGQFTVPGRTAAVFKQVPGEVKLLPNDVEPVCECATTGADAALGAAALALATLWRRRRRSAAQPGSNPEVRNP